jgi:RNA polymerase sigma-70 factor (ECF subfamily)
MHMRKDADDRLARLSALVHKERGALAALARAEGVPAEDAVECVQEALCTFLVSARRGTALEDRGAWGAVLAGMVRNAARNRRRRHFRSRPHLEVEGQPLADAASLADELIARAEDHVRLHACVDELCDIQKAVVTLRMLEEQPGEDVAEVLGITPGHVAVLLHRATRALRVCMTGA